MIVATKATPHQMTIVSIGKSIQLALPLPRALKLIELLAEAKTIERTCNESGYSFAASGQVYVEMVFVYPPQPVTNPESKVD